MITIPGNGAKMLAPCNFPMVAVGRHRHDHFNQSLDCILSDIVREGSLLSQKNSHIHMALNKHAEGYISTGNRVVCKLKIERQKMIKPLGDGFTV